MNYIQKVRNRLEALASCHGSLLDLYTLLVFTKGVECTLKDVHDAWAVWKNKTMPDHRSLIDFYELSTEVQELDREYCEAIQRVAEEMS